jgi:hypothetical protein
MRGKEYARFKEYRIIRKYTRLREERKRYTECLRIAENIRCREYRSDEFPRGADFGGGVMLNQGWGGVGRDKMSLILDREVNSMTNYINYSYATEAVRS